MAKKQPEGFEDHLSKLERIVEELESGDLSLDDSLARYQEGVKRLKSCHLLLRKAEDQVKLLVQDAEGELSTEPLEGEAE